MIFNSFQFALFALPVLLVYWLLPHRWQNRFLLVASYVFYGSWDWRFLSLILLSTLVDYYCGLGLDGEGGRSRKMYLGISLTVNLGLLGVFKYFNFFIQSASSGLELAGVHVSPLTLSVVLPVGISFYTFQTLSYTIDVYYGKVKACRSLPDFALFVAFFPQLVAGPIEKARRFLPQILAPRAVTLKGFYEGCYLVFWGLFKKVFVADNCAKIAETVFRGGVADDVHGIYYLVGAYAFAWQIYCDFSGYTDIARGLAKLMGFDLMLNFNMPYFATDLADFWRRWHISLSTWFREYLYIPLGGNRVTRPRLAGNLMVVFVVSGLWHGAAMNFVVWGAAHGVGLVFLTLWGRQIERVTSRLPRRLWQPLSVFITFNYVAITFAVWQTKTVADWLVVVQRIAFDLNPTSVDLGLLGKLAGLVALPVLVQWLQKRAEDPMLVLAWPPLPRGALYVACLFCLLRFGVFDGAEFIYFQF